MAKVTKQTRRKRSVKKPARKRRRTSPQKSTGSGGFRGKRATCIFLWGPSGVGKTSFAANFPKCGFVYDPQEEGIADLVEFNQAPEPVFQQEVDNFDDVFSVCADAANGEYDIETLVFDSLTGLEKLCFSYHCEHNFDGDWSSEGFYAYQRGPKNAAKTDIPRMLDAFDAVRKSGINVIMIGHSQVKTFNNPEGADYDMFTPVCDKETWSQVHRWAKAVLFYNYYYDVDTRKSLKGKAVGESESRYIYTVRSGAFQAKNRWGLEPCIDAGESGQEAFENFCEAFDKAANV